MLRAPDLVGCALDDRYELLAPIGEGAFGWVYEGRDRRLARAVAVKVIKPWWADDGEWVQRFEREAQMLARVNDPGIVQIYEVGESGGHRSARERVAVLSRGQVQRLSLARALLHSPHHLLLDEPDTGLDQKGRDLVEALLAEHTAHGGTILFTTHQLERALQLSDSIIMLNKGRIVFQQKTVNLELDKVQRTYQEVT